MKTQNKPTFAQRAKKLDSTYKNRIHDKILDGEYNDLMEKLVAEQEAVRGQMGLSNDNGQDRMMPIQEAPQQFEKGSYLPNSPRPEAQLPWVQDNSYWENIGRDNGVNYPVKSSIVQSDPAVLRKIPPKIRMDNKTNYEFAPIKDEVANPIISSGNSNIIPELGRSLTDVVGYNAKSFSDPEIEAEINNRIFNPTATIANNGNRSIKLSNDSVKSGSNLINKTGSTSNEFLPSYISAGANVLNNVLQGVLARKPKDIAPASYKPKEIDMTDRMLEAKRQAELSSNIARNQARNMGLNAGATIANQAGAQSGIDRNLASALTDINQAQQQYNVGEANKASEFGASNKMRADMINEQMKQQFNQTKLDSLSGAVGTIPELISDINKIKAQNKTFAQMTESEKAKFKLYQQLYGNYKETGFDPTGNISGLMFNKTSK